MRQIKRVVHISFWCFIYHFFFYQTTSTAQVNLGEDIDCTDVRIDYSDDPSLTQEERLRLMDQALFDSLNKFEFCQSAKNKGKGSGASGSGTAGAGGGDGSTDSVASSVMSGTESPSQDNQNSVETPQDKGGQPPLKRQASGNNGKLPDDIPPAANDDVLAAQIRHAAENEKDPAKQQLLWDEYRKYKGLPPKN